MSFQCLIFDGHKFSSRRSFGSRWQAWCESRKTSFCRNHRRPTRLLLVIVPFLFADFLSCHRSELAFATGIQLTTHQQRGEDQVASRILSLILMLLWYKSATFWYFEKIVNCWIIKIIFVSALSHWIVRPVGRLTVRAERPLRYCLYGGPWEGTIGVRPCRPFRDRKAVTQSNRRHHLLRSKRHRSVGPVLCQTEGIPNLSDRGFSWISLKKDDNKDQTNSFTLSSLNCSIFITNQREERVIIVSISFLSYSSLLPWYRHVRDVTLLIPLSPVVCVVHSHLFLIFNTFLISHWLRNFFCFNRKNKQRHGTESLSQCFVIHYATTESEWFTCQCTQWRNIRVRSFSRGSHASHGCHPDLHGR